MEVIISTLMTSGVVLGVIRQKDNTALFFNSTDKLNYNTKFDTVIAAMLHHDEVLDKMEKTGDVVKKERRNYLILKTIS